MEIVKSIFGWIQIIFSVYTFVVALVEEHGVGGDAKKKEAIARIKGLVGDAVGAGQIPSWLGSLMTIDVILGMGIDWIVGWLNKAGFFTHSETANTPS
jgi:hypothetical protein